MKKTIIKGEGIEMSLTISEKDKMILRETAKEQMEFANSETNRKKIKAWYKHNACQGESPLIHLEIDTFEQEILPMFMKCEGEEARKIEHQLYRNFLNAKLFEDDKVVPDYFGVPYESWFTLFVINVHVEKAKEADSVGHHFVEVIGDLEEDYGKIGKTDFGVKKEESEKRADALREIFQEVIPVRMKMDGLYSVPTQMIVHIMSMENMMFNMYDYPELFKKMMDTIAEDTLAYYRYLEKEGVILPTTAFEWVGQGSAAFTRELPGEEEWKKRPFTTKDVWGFMDSQETVGISPEMYEEFIFPCYKKISEQYGMLSYGCCEPVDPIWDNCISKLENLRKVSISPWCQEEIMGERLRGSKVIFHRKPSPNYLGVGDKLDEEGFRAHIRKSILAARGCEMEITQRDVYTINHDIDKAHRYVQIIREEIEKNWR